MAGWRLRRGQRGFLEALQRDPRVDFAVLAGMAGMDPLAALAEREPTRRMVLQALVERHQHYAELERQDLARRIRNEIAEMLGGK